MELGAAIASTGTYGGYRQCPDMLCQCQVQEGDG